MVSALLCSLLAGTPAPAAAHDLSVELRDLLAIPYVNDEARDETGRWTFFANPEKTAESPGLNCSGFVLAVAQRVLGCKLTLAEATRDRLGDSGDDSKGGRDWDFGWDLVMNLSEGHPRSILLPDGEQEVEKQDARTMRGFPVTDEKAWKKVFPQLKPDHLYFASMSRVARRLEHHHVAVILKDAGGQVWFYQTLPKGHSHRLELTSPKGFERMQKMFGAGVRVLLVQVEAPVSAVAHE